MKQEEMKVLSVKEIASSTFEMKLALKSEIGPVVPGQFLHIKVGNGTNHLLRRPISVANFDEEKKNVTIVFKQTGEGTRELSEYKQNDSLFAIIPCGTGYPLETLDVKKALLIGGGIGIPPLFYLGQKLKDSGVKITSILGFQTSDQVFYEEEFLKLGKTTIVTQDGSYGKAGLVTDMVEIEDYDFDYFFTCGPTGMLRAVSQQLGDKQGYISVEQRMGCGIGACYACVVPSSSSADGFKKICKDGPVFAVNEVTL